MTKHDATWSGDKVYFSHEDGMPCWIKVKEHIGGMADVLAEEQAGVWTVTHNGKKLTVISVSESDPDDTEVSPEDVDELAEWESRFREEVAADKSEE